MAISRAQLAKELEPGLNALFGMEFARYENQHAEIFTTESSDRSFEEEVMLSGFGAAPVKQEGSGVSFDDANESFTARYNHETVALAFSITEEAVEDNRQVLRKVHAWKPTWWIWTGDLNFRLQRSSGIGDLVYHDAVGRHE